MELPAMPQFNNILDIFRPKKPKEIHAATLNEFISMVKRDGLVPLNRFTVEFALPNSIRTLVGGSGSQLANMHISGLNLPGVQLTTTQSKTYGELREFPYEKLFNNINMNFYVSGGKSKISNQQLMTLGIFNAWIGSVQNPYTREFSYYEDYITDIIVTIQDKAEDDVHAIKFFECYPKAIGDIHLDYSSKDIMILPVSMNYKYWRPVESNTIITPSPMLGNSVTVRDTTLASYTGDNGEFQTTGEA